MINFKPILIGLVLSGIISVLGSPVFAYLWGPISPASSVFAFITISLRFLKTKNDKFTIFLVLISGLFFLDFLMGKYYLSTTGNSSLILTIGSVLVLLLTVSFITILGKLDEYDLKTAIFSYGTMAFAVYFYGIVYGAITPGVSDGPKLAAIISLLTLKFKGEKELTFLWHILFIMGVAGNFILPFITYTGIVDETF